MEQNAEGQAGRVLELYALPVLPDAHKSIEALGLREALREVQREEGVTQVRVQLNMDCFLTLGERVVALRVLQQHWARVDRELGDSREARNLAYDAYRGTLYPAVAVWLSLVFEGRADVLAEEYNPWSFLLSWDAGASAP